MGFISGLSGFTAASERLSSLSTNLVARQPSSPAVQRPALEHAATADNALNLNDAIEQEKSLSFVYQMLLAIARQNQNKETDLAVNNEKTANQIEFKLEHSNLETRIAEVNSNISLNLSMTSNSQSSLSLDISTDNSEQSDPLILNLDNTDFKFNSNQKVSFDLNADGRLDQFNNLTSNNAFLAFDKNSNGIIDDGSEFFGDTRGSVDGFADLALYDSNQDKQIDANDHIFKNLLLVQFSPMGEQIISPLGSHNIKSLSLNHQISNQVYAGNNLLTSKATFDFDDGRSGVIGDFLLSIS